jgi:uncharacterized RDD family membrane protein YckC
MCFECGAPLPTKVDIGIDLWEGRRCGLASPWLRWGAQIIDGIISYIPVMVMAFFTRAPGAPAIIIALLSIGWFFFYLLFADGLPGSGSWGKHMLGAVVIDERTGRPCTFGQSFVRNIFLIVLGPIDWLFIFGQKHQRLGDKVAHTVVVRLAR